MEMGSSMVAQSDLKLRKVLTFVFKKLMIFIKNVFNSIFSATQLRLYNRISFEQMFRGESRGRFIDKAVPNVCRLEPGKGHF